MYPVYAVIGTRPNFLYTEYGGYRRGLTYQANVRTHYVKKLVIIRYGRIPIQPAILAAIGHRFIAKQ